MNEKKTTEKELRPEKMVILRKIGLLTPFYDDEEE